MSTNLIRRGSIEELTGHRNRALQLFESIQGLLREAEEAVKRAAPSVPFYLDRDVLRKDDFLPTVRKQIDRVFWDSIIRTTDLEKLMDHTARKEFRQQLHDDPPEATADNVFSTLQDTWLRRGEIFKRGIAKAFSGLDRRFKTHDGFSIGSKIIIERAFDEHGHLSRYTYKDEVIRDIEKTFHILDDRQVPNDYAGILGALREAIHENSPGFMQMAAAEAETEFFRARCFKNGNVHLWFKRDDLVRQVNLLLAEYYGAVIGNANSDKTNTKRKSHAKNYGLFNSPPDVVQAVMAEARIEASHHVLEPSAGKGNLALAASAVAQQVDVCEIQIDLASVLRNSGRFSHVWNMDFLDMEPRPNYDRVIMNPPFDRGLDIDHVLHAYQFLKPGGLLVSVMTPSVTFKTDTQAKKLRAIGKSQSNWDDFSACYRDLPERSFAGEGTNVNTILLTLRRPS